MGRPTFKPTDEQRGKVEALAGYGISHDEIALLVGCSSKTLSESFRAELDLGQTKANARVSESLFQQAVGAPAIYDQNGNCVRKEQPRDTSAALYWARERADSTAPQQQIGRPFKPGESGNPAGRPRGSRNKLGEAFIEALHDDFLQHGVRTIARVRATDPVAYVKVCASILPKELKIETHGDLSDDELDRRIRQLAAAISLEIGTDRADGGTETTH